MTNQIDALKLALEALDALCLNDYSGYEMGKRDTHLVDTAIDAIKAALAQPAQEPDHGDELTIAYMSGVHRGKELAAQPAQGPDYAYPTIEGYEEITGFKVNDTFRMGWAMARTTNDLFKQMEKHT
jgi:hypothetical protein